VSAEYHYVTVTFSTHRSCEWCGERFALARGPGRPPKYCRKSHRQRAYEARRIADARGLGPDEVLITRRTWERLRDALYRLEAAAEDVAMDVLQGNATKAAYVEALGHLSAAVRELQDVAVEPVAIGG
jgi:hypothetical protein